MEQQKATKLNEQMWDDSIIPTLMEYIKIPNQSPQFDPNWQANGYMDAAMRLLYQWCEAHAVPNMTMEIIQLENRTPLLLIDVPGQSDDTILLYGHMDKQPEMIGWSPGLSAWTPVLRGDKLYGRGAADDGYATFAALGALNILHAQSTPHARCVILIEASEESGSPDLPFYIEALKDKIGTPNLVICLDSGCGNYQQLWVTTSLRGLLGGILSINILRDGIHSGVGSGIVPSCLRILRQLLSRIESESTGDVILSDLQVTIPPTRIEQATITANILGEDFYNDLPFVPGAKPETQSVSQLLLRRTWCPALSVIGIDGLPPTDHAGNVTIPALKVKLSMRLPPTLNAESAASALKTSLEQDPPYHASVHFDINETGSGWNAPKEAAWLLKAVDQASLDQFGKPAAYMGEGGSIPFMGMLGKLFPEAQFLITGVLGPESNAHGPNEFLHIPMAKKLTLAVAEVIEAQFKANK